MNHIDLQYKEASPAETVERIRSILSSLDIEVEEHWGDSGIENCQSLFLTTPLSSAFYSNGKGVSRDLARASAYGEFIERLQCGLNFYKLQSIGRDPKMVLQTYAPDAKYMSTRELEENGEWMDHLIRSYPGLSRKLISKHCRSYANTDDDKILTVPFYSLFEDKYVYLPAGFTEYMYTANGCCAGNTKEEAWLHAISEIFERRGDRSAVLGLDRFPIIDRELLNSFPTVSKILGTIEAHSDYDLQFLDFSLGTGYPVVAACLIDKKTHSFIVNAGADPILEIALERTLTELFQGRHLRNSYLSRSSLREIEYDIPDKHNVINQLQTGDGAYPVSFFTENDKVTDCNNFQDYTGMKIKEILPKVLEICKKLDRPLYIRNFSFLGFPCYKIIIPGFSETHALNLQERIPEYAMGSIASTVLRNIEAASIDDIQLLLLYLKQIRSLRNVRNRFNRLAGLPISNEQSAVLLQLTESYAYWRTGRTDLAVAHLDKAASLSANEHDSQYFSCLVLYLKLKQANVQDDQIKSVLFKFFDRSYPTELYAMLDSGQSPYANHLLKCDTVSCANCRYKDDCTYTNAKEIIAKLGKEYQKFTHGQDREQFQI